VEKLTAIQTRLKEHGRRTGFACLFYGAPGTGNTESVLELARKTGRDIMQVDMSEIKSKWVGESEQNIKAVFDNYRALCNTCDKTPILLFNEADAILGTRMGRAMSAVDKMNNAIQNIVLQEMETLDGIMIATTNLEKSLDPAFERRFIYKVRFTRPGVKQRKNIWKSMLPALSDDMAVQLASSFDFSGGQIENVARKCDVKSVLYGESSIDEETIIRFCKEESIHKKNIPHIGFV
jgi:SpoVK/Ycf46/Vps4 family AAA+-type ATPase